LLSIINVQISSTAKYFVDLKKKKVKTAFF